MNLPRRRKWIYDRHYGQLDADPLVAARRETYDEDLGQASWITMYVAAKPSALAAEHPDGAGGAD